MNWLRERFEALRSIFEPLSNGAKTSDEGRFAIVEIMGHRKVAGRVRDVQAFGRTMIEVVCAEPSQTVVKLSPAAIFAITECSNDEATACQNGAPPDPLAYARFEAKAAQKRAFAEYEARGKPCLICDYGLEDEKGVCSNYSCPSLKAEPEPIDDEFEGPSSAPVTDRS